MKSEPESFGKFVKLGLTGEIVELENYNSSSMKVTIKYRGQSVNLSFDEIEILTPEEMSKHEQFLNQSRAAA